MKPKMYRTFLRHPQMLNMLVAIKSMPKKISGKRQFKKDLKSYKSMNKDSRFEIAYKYVWPFTMDRYENAGSEGAYFWQDLWCAKLIYENKPLHHYDIGSRIDGFIAHLASFRDNIHLIDIRPFDMNIPGVDFVQANATEMGGWRINP